jgi:hypothetical protein
MADSLLDVVQRFCRKTNITVPSVVIGTSDPQVAQVYALLEEEGNELSGRGSWQALTVEATHTTLAAEVQGDIVDIADEAFRYIKNNTIWDRTENLPVVVIDGVDWQAEKGFASTSPRYRARIRGGELIVTPTPVAGNTWAFEYVTWNWINQRDKQYFTNDSDTIDLPMVIVEMGLRWRWKKEKGLEYAEDFRSYETMVADALGRQGMLRTLNQGLPPEDATPKIVVNQGNWPL